MRPQPSEIIAGIRTILAETIAPELTSDHATSRLSEIRAVLAQVNWDDSAFDLKKKTVLLASCLQDAEDWVTTAASAPPADESFAAYLEYWDHLATIAIAALDRLNAHLDEQPDDESALDARRRLVAAL